MQLSVIANNKHFFFHFFIFASIFEESEIIHQFFIFLNLIFCNVTTIIKHVMLSH